MTKRNTPPVFCKNLIKHFDLNNQVYKNISALNSNSKNFLNKELIKPIVDKYSNHIDEKFNEGCVI